MAAITRRISCSKALLSGAGIIEAGGGHAFRPVAVNHVAGQAPSVALRISAWREQKWSDDIGHFRCLAITGETFYAPAASHFAVREPQFGIVDVGDDRLSKGAPIVPLNQASGPTLIDNVGWPMGTSSYNRQAAGHSLSEH